MESHEEVAAFLQSELTRLRRVVEVGGIDVADPEARFAAMLELRTRSH